MAASYDKWTPAIRVGILYNKRKRINGAVRASLGYVVGENLDRYLQGQPEKPNTYFNTTVFTLQYDLRYNLLKRNWGLWYISQGFGIIRFTPHDRNGDPLVDNKASREQGEEYNDLSTILPTVFGFVWLHKSGFGLGLEAGWLNLTTDYIDNVSALSNSNQEDNIATININVLIPVWQGREQKTVKE